jgi:branched-subunit amino acid transport protein
MSTWSAIVLVLAVGVGTYLMRAGLVLLLADRPMRPAVERALRNVGPAVLAALTVSLVASDGADGGSSVELAEAAALVVAAVVAWRRFSLLVTLGAGMVTVWVVSAVVA